MSEIPITPEGVVPVGKEEYTFVERQGETDVSGVPNYPNKITISVNADIAWQTAIKILEQIRYGEGTTFDLIIYGQLAEKV